MEKEKDAWQKCLSNNLFLIDRRLDQDSIHLNE